MGLRERLDEDLKVAIRSQDVLRRSVLRLIRSEIHNEEISIQKSLDDDGIVRVISRQVRQRKESIIEFSKAGRPDLTEREKSELAVVMGYLPQQLEEDEIIAVIREIVCIEDQPQSYNKGKIMGLVMTRLKGRADGSTVNELVTKFLDNANEV